MDHRVFRSFSAFQLASLWAIIALLVLSGSTTVPSISAKPALGDPLPVTKPDPSGADWKQEDAAFRAALAAQNPALMQASARRLFQIAQASGDPVRLASAHHNLGIALLKQGELTKSGTDDAGRSYRSACQEFDHALALMPTIGDTAARSVIAIQSNMSEGEALYRLREPAQAIAHFENSIGAATEAHATALLPGMLRNLGVIADGRKDTADYFQKQGAIFEGQGMPECAAWCDYSLAGMRPPVDAIATLKAAISQTDRFDQKEESEIRAMVFQSLGLLYDQQGAFEKAIDAYKRADGVWQKRFLGSPAHSAEQQAECRCNTANCLLKLGELEAGIKEYDRALQLRPFSPGFSEWAAIEKNRDFALQGFRLLWEALKNNQALVLPDFHSQKTTAVAIESIGRLLQAPGDVLAHATAAMNLAKELRAAGVSGKADQVYQLAQSALERDLAPTAPPASLADVGAERLFLGQIDLELRSPQQAASVLEQARQDLEKGSQATALAYCLALLAVAQGDAGETAKAEQTFQAAIQDFEARQSQLNAPERLGPFQSVQASTLYADYAALLAHSGRNEEALLMADSPRGRGMARQALHLLAKPNVSAQERQTKELLWTKPFSRDELHTLTQAHPDTLYLHYDVGTDGVMLLAFGANTPVQCLRLDKSYIDLLRDLDAWIKNITHWGRAVDEEPLARRLGVDLLGPLYKSGLLSSTRTGMRWRRLVIVPDGGLYNVPFAALILPESKSQRLIERLPVSIAISLRQAARHQAQVKSNNKILVIGDPTSDGKSVASRSTPIRQDGSLEPSLPAYHVAARQIVQQFPGQVTLLIGPKARRESVLKLLPDYDILVFATHGHPDAEHDGLASYLTLAPEGTRPGRLEASEILTTPLSARLTFLLACETAQGQFAGEEGCQGLVWAFLSAGCPSVVASLWQVDPNTSGKLSTLFLQNLKQGLPTDVALQKAAIQTRSKFAQTRDWAAFEPFGIAISP